MPRYARHLIDLLPLIVMIGLAAAAMATVGCNQMPGPLSVDDASRWFIQTSPPLYGRHEDLWLPHPDPEAQLTQVRTVQRDPARDTTP